MWLPAVFILFAVFGYNSADDIMSVFSGATVSMAATPEKTVYDRFARKR